MSKSAQQKCVKSGVVLRLSAAFCAAFVAAGAPGSGMAVEFGKAVINDTVPNRIHKEYEPIGIRAGSFMIFPTLRTEVEYNDNIYAERTGKADDFILGLRPEIAVRSLWQRHSLRMNAYGDFGIYTDNSSEDYQDAGFIGDARFDISDDTRIFARMAAQRRHEDRDSPDDSRGATPTVFYRLAPELRLEQRFSRLALRLKANVEDLDYQDVESVGGAIINEDDRDRLMWTVEGRAGYDVSENVQVYVSGLLDERKYNVALDDQGFNRDSSGYGVFGGVIVEVTGTISAEAYVGYRSQSFKDPALTNVNGIGGGLNVIWAPTKLTTVTVTGERTVEETTQLGGTASFNTWVGVTVDHELRRNLVLTLGGRYTNRHYEGISRNDNMWRGSLGMKYLVSRHLRLQAGYTYSNRNSTLLNESFDMNVAYVNLHVDY